MTRDNHWTVDMGSWGGFTAFAVYALPVVTPHFDNFAVLGMGLCRHPCRPYPIKISTTTINFEYNEPFKWSDSGSTYLVVLGMGCGRVIRFFPARLSPL
jgi:hypothetical protein